MFNKLSNSVQANSVCLCSTPSLHFNLNFSSEYNLVPLRYFWNFGNTKFHVKPNSNFMDVMEFIEISALTLRSLHDWDFK